MVLYFFAFPVDNGDKELYDAFICINLDKTDLRNVNNRFAHKLIDRFETNGNLRLYVPNGDDIPNAERYEEYAQLIQDR